MENADSLDINANIQALGRIKQTGFDGVKQTSCHGEQYTMPPPQPMPLPRRKQTKYYPIVFFRPGLAQEDNMVAVMPKLSQTLKRFRAKPRTQPM